MPMPEWIEKIWHMQKPAAWLIESAGAVALAGYYAYSKSKQAQQSAANQQQISLPPGISPADLAGIPYGFQDSGGDTLGPGGSSYSYGAPAPGSLPTPTIPMPTPTPAPAPPPAPAPTGPSGPTPIPQPSQPSGSQPIWPDPMGTPGESNNFHLYTTQPGDTLQKIAALANWSQYGPDKGATFLYNYRNNARVFQALGIPNSPTVQLPMNVEISI